VQLGDDDNKQQNLGGVSQKNESMLIPHLQPFDGDHCETTATGTLLHQLDIHLSEPMLFGLGEGLGYIFWKLKVMDLPFIGGRVKPDALTASLARNLNLRLTVRETSSPTKAWNEVKSLLENGKAVGLKLDCFHLEYFKRPFHFAGHYVALCGYDEEFAYMVDTRQQNGLNKTSLESLSKARSEKGPMSSKNLYYTLESTDRPFDLKHAIPQAIRNNATEFLNPPISNIGYRGIERTAKEVIKWYENSKNVEKDFKMMAMLMERAGTGGALFRNLYRDFLKEIAEHLQSDIIHASYTDFVEIAALWSEVSRLFEQAALNQDIAYIKQSSSILKDLSVREKSAMERLVWV
jgi:Domain of unknown function (DUF4872)/Butirosin biosynthesis protein H, N-terminal